MRQPTFITPDAFNSPTRIKLVHRETGDRYAAYRFLDPSRGWECLRNGHKQTMRPDRTEALRWIEQEARIAMY